MTSVSASGFTDRIILFLKDIVSDEYLLLFIISMLPFSEMRGAVILSAGMDVNALAALFVCWAGSSLVCLPIMAVFTPAVRAMKKRKFFAGLAEKAQSTVAGKASALSGREGFLPLMLFVAVPLPMTGVWAGSAIAAILGVGYKKAVAAVATGNLIATGLVLLLSALFKNYTDLLLLALTIAVVFGILLSVYRSLGKNKKDG